MNGTQTVNGTTYKAETPSGVIVALENTRATGRRVRLFYGDVGTGKSWGDENDVCGRVGRSNGTQRVPILLHNSRSMGGSPVLDACIVAIRHADGWSYRHPSFDAGVYALEDIHDEEKYPFRVSRDGEVVARFETREKAARWMSFMRGERMGK